MSEDARSDHLEPGGVSTARVLIFAAGYMGLLLASVIVLYFVYAGAVPAVPMPTIRLFPPPRQEPHPADELHALLAKQRAELSGYGWADAGHTLVKIPIERAMDIIAARGTQAYDPIERTQPRTNPPTGGSQ